MRTRASIAKGGDMQSFDNIRSGLLSQDMPKQITNTWDKFRKLDALWRTSTLDALRRTKEGSNSKTIKLMSSHFPSMASTSKRDLKWTTSKPRSILDSTSGRQNHYSSQATGRSSQTTLVTCKNGELMAGSQYPQTTRSLLKSGLLHGYYITYVFSQ